MNWQVAITICNRPAIYHKADSSLEPSVAALIKECLFMCQIENVTKGTVLIFMSLFLINLLFMNSLNFINSISFICRPSQSQPETRYSVVKGF